MKYFWFLLIAMGLALNVGMLACSSDDDDSSSDSDSDSDGDSDTDSDSDSDSDTDSDTDSDSDSDADACGTLDIDCCLEEPACEGDLICVGGVSEVDPNAAWCLAPCTPITCTTVVEDEGNCQDLGGGVGICITAADFTASDCTADDCTSPSGATSGTTCVSDGTTNYCFELCTPGEDECDVVHYCAGLTSGGGACIPQ